MQNLDRRTINECGIPGIVLMENAGRGAAQAMAIHFPHLPAMRVAIVCGRGNNGGDGFVIARCLMARGTTVAVYLLSEADRVKGDAKVNLDAFIRSGGRVVQVSGSEQVKGKREEIVAHDLLVDAMFGTGLNSEISGFYAEVIDCLNGSGKPIVAVDIPSGLDPNTGRPLGACITATVTVTFGLPKLGQVIYPGLSHVGELDVIDIGIPASFVEEEGIKISIVKRKEIQAILACPRPPESHKGDYGHLIAIAGSVGKTGAAAMACESAMRVGAGLVTLGIPESLNTILETRLTETMTLPLPETGSQSFSLDALEPILSLTKGKSVAIIGPGISTTPETMDLIRTLVRSLPIPMVIDAEGITALSPPGEALREAKSPVILTPHPGEMARLLGISTNEVQENRLEVARKSSIDFGCHVVLKGARTVISTPAGEVFINPTGNPGMASGGMGDILTGMIGGFICQGLNPRDAAIAGTYVHGLAGDVAASKKGERSLIATDLIEAIPTLLRDLTARDANLNRSS
jgi:NAD(P)H-hydrate epimerase